VTSAARRGKYTLDDAREFGVIRIATRSPAQGSVEALKEARRIAGLVPQGGIDENPST
jgi:hypothetical protein